MRVKINKSLKHGNISYSIRGHIIPSRFFFAPINTGLSNNGTPTQELIKFHRERSGKEIGISYVGNVSIEADYTTNKNTSYFNDDLTIWKELTNSILQSGSIPGVQIACRSSSIKPNRKMINNNHDEYIRIVQEEILSLTVEQIKKIIELFVDNAIIANSVGFKVIQIHAAHGYFLSQMLNPLLNVRRDEFGFNRTTIIKEIVQGIREKLNDNVIIDIRISLIDGIKTQEEEISYKEFLIKQLTDLDIDMISFSNGIYDINKHLIYPLKEWGHGVFVNMVLPFANKYPEFLWNVAGNIWSLKELKLNDLPSNLTLSIGRSLIADPKFLEKSLIGLEESINYCERKHQCHYYSLGKEDITCPVYEKSKISM